jgi:hypothetical protein
MKKLISIGKLALLSLTLFLGSCSNDDDNPSEQLTPTTILPGSFIKGEVGNFYYDSTTGGGQTFATKIQLPFVGDQITIASVLGDTKTLNLTFFPPTGTGVTEGICFYSPDGTAANSIGNDDNCSGVFCDVIITSNNGSVIEGTFTANLKKSDCTGPTTPIVGGMFKAVVAQ